VLVEGQAKSRRSERMVQRTATEFRLRKTYAKIPRTINIPDLISLQKQSYDKFLQKDVAQEQRQNLGLQGIFKSVFPIWDFNKTSSLEFVDYKLDPPKYDVDECRQRGMTFAAPVKVLIRLVVWDTNPESKVQSIRDVKEQEVYFGEIPLMTENGTFIINGTERVIVSQLHRSPGAFFEHDKGKTHASGKLIYSARIIPYRGSWLDFEFDQKDLLFVRIDRRRKMYATVLLRALGYSTEDLLNFFYNTETVVLGADAKFHKVINYELMVDQRATQDIRHPDTGEVIVRKNRKVSKNHIRKMRDAGLTEIELEAEDLDGKVLAHDIIDEETGEVVFECNEELDVKKLEELRRRGVTQSFDILFFDNLNVGSYLRDTLVADKVQTTEDAILEIYRRLRPGDPSTPAQAKNYFNNLFFNSSRYDLSPVGRLKLNFKFRAGEGTDQRPAVPLDTTVLTKEDILDVVKYLIDLKNGRGTIDDIDHLGNRRVRAVGELLENQYRVGLVRMERAIKERMSMSQEIDTLMPHDLINAKPVSAVVKEYFGSSQLSQFMDQTNPLSEVTHKRRLSALGPGGLTRDRAGFEVRDVHTTHYGRICPIETPEGPNIGLIASLSTYAKVNEYGFIETPYRRVQAGTVTPDVDYYSALQEEQETIAQANASVGTDGALLGEFVSARKGGESSFIKTEEITLMDVSPNQLVSVAASLIPFLENDDANRALMGSNMQRQAVPLIRTAAPLVGTGMERVVAADSGVTVVAKHDGVVESVDAGRIVVRRDFDPEDISSAKPDIYKLIKFQRSNQSTCVNQKPIVRKGDRAVRGQVIGDGPATEMGELALGANVLVAFMPWGGYNFEDSILISERLVKEDVFTSIHIEEFECIARDTKLGKEEITRDIPNVGEEALKNLDDSGIIRIGAEVKSGDILVGKVTPKGETQLSPEEKLLRAIFGEKAGDVRDTSLRVPPGVVGTVIAAQVFSRKGVDKDERTMLIEQEEIQRIEKDRDDEIRILRAGARQKVAEILSGRKTVKSLISDTGQTLVGTGTAVTPEVLDKIPSPKYWAELQVENGSVVEEQVDRIVKQLEQTVDAIRTNCDEKIKRLEKGDELPPGVIKMVKVYVAIKRKLQVGDKMAGRHGNKGVVSRVLPEEDMPYMLDGRPVDMVLNPLGVPSRMNVGQILETHLGMAARALGEQLNRYMTEEWSASKLREALLRYYSGPEQQAFVKSLADDDVKQLVVALRNGIHVATPVFDGAKEADIRALLSEVGIPDNGQTVLFDGRTGEAFDQNVTVGIMYVLKLHHLVDDKIHARSIGPYSLVTQQPLGGKAQFGGQRLGEMEVWAMEAYGAAHTLQEFLTVKSDDVVGRTRMYEAIVKGENALEAGLPESFNVLVKELKALALDVELTDSAAEG
jgi:DNA-directed RNA polymerase subunit beta